MAIEISDRRDVEQAAVLDLYRANGWSAAQKPTELYQSLLHSHALFTAWEDGKLVGLGNALSDGYLVVYYSHLLVHPAYHGQGIGQAIMARMQEKYGHFHMQVLVADGKAVDFYRKSGFERAGRTEPMWIYEGDEH